VRDSQKPSASVMVSMFSGRVLDPGQVNGIVHLIASSVPELAPRNVTVVDQAGNLLSGPPGESRNGSLDAAQLKYLHQVEAAIAARIENILKPITGPENVRAQVAATLDFSEVEQTSEIFKPNAAPQDQAIRSQQSSESNSTTPQPPQGVPGALSNTPPGAATAPLVAPQAGTPPGQAAVPPATTSQREQTVNYEVDKTIRHTRGEIGAIKRLSVAVVVNYRRGSGDSAKPEPLSEQELAQVTDLAREAMGFSRERGDTLNVVNAAFRDGLAASEAATVPIWKDPFYVSLAVEILKVLVVVVAGFVVLRMILSVVRDLARLGQPQLAGAGAGGGSIGMAGGEAAGYGPGGQPEAGAEASPESAYEADLRAAREIARQDPRIVAQVVKDWVGRE
jgi:flagellar M-ring protein FliF